MDQAQGGLQRDLSLHFGHRFLGGIRYEEVLEALDKEIDIGKLNSIQITEKDCVVTVSENDLKQKLLTRDHTLSSDLPLMRFFFISPQQKISSLHTGNETDSEFEVFSKRMTF